MQQVFAPVRIGQGYDLHRLQMHPGTGLLLGGFLVGCDYSSIAHSDGDALCHAVIDSLLGALALGDIGTYFPPSEERWRNANSLEMLHWVYSEQILANAYQLVNLDCTVILEKIRLRLLIDDIRQSLLRGFRSEPPLQGSTEGSNYNNTPPVTLEQISIKAKTKEGVGAVGRGDAIEVFATCLLQNVAAH